MSRKVNIKVEVEVMVPVKVTLDVLVRAEEGVNMERVLNKWANGDKHPDADVEDVTIEKIDTIGGSEVEVEDGTLGMVMEEHFFDYASVGKLKNSILSSKVTDSR